MNELIVKIFHDELEGQIKLMMQIGVFLNDNYMQTKLKKTSIQ